MTKLNKKQKGIKKEGEQISRREAIGKMGYAAFASSSLFLLLNNPTRAQATSPSDGGDDGIFERSDNFDFGSDQNNTQDEWGTGDNDDWK